MRLALMGSGGTGADGETGYTDRCSNRQSSEILEHFTCEEAVATAWAAVDQRFNHERRQYEISLE